MFKDNNIKLNNCYMKYYVNMSLQVSRIFEINYNFE